MKTRMTQSGSADRFRQGISLIRGRKVVTSRFTSLLPWLRTGTPLILAVSGSSDPPSLQAFYDDQAPTGNQRVGGKRGYHLIPNARLELPVLGETDPYIGKNNYFTDRRGMPITGSNSINWLLDRNNSGSLAPVERFQSDVSIGQMDGIIEIWPLRKILDRSAPFPGPDWVKRFHGSLCSMFTDESMMVGTVRAPVPCPLYEITQYRYIPSITERSNWTMEPFNDRTAALPPGPYAGYVPRGGLWMGKPIRGRASGSMVTASISLKSQSGPLHNVFPSGTSNFRYIKSSSFLPPFDDISKQQAMLNATYSSKGRGLPASVEANTDIKNELLKMTGTFGLGGRGLKFNQYIYSMTAGYTYTTSQLTGSRMGTDSLAYGGLRR